ncbi:hypothetical protein M2132_001023 [Dysgonomonas sp. PH5-45]|uniref:phosphoadenosine phosphosulfate reductase domain-containing protein n=1 Tax=unclassified Dysgonomonas TaxID=2630389 RepID=UPI0024743058|nr:MULTISPECIES: phosphoadenosine phosphosulfate reductase family protein [unclassified Dysgonomonas]MDH6354694.1 hypothetical protein [Dysgonomonas sp. PH5-45]MDH6387592.1 hypothetical protein [Dysgonomonas sp. PH5-37]
MDKDIIAWWSGGASSAVACKLAIDLFGANRVRVIFQDTRNEDDDTYRFLKDCEKWYGIKIEIISSKEFNSIEEVWYKYLSLSVAGGAICSTKLKREVREQWEKENTWAHQVFGYDMKEAIKRAVPMTLNNPKLNAIYPLLLYGYFKKDCIKILDNAGIKVPEPYIKGYENNNCDKTGCTRGGIGYWQKRKREEYNKFYKMAMREHELTNLKGEPVTICKDQSNEAKKKGGYVPVFLLPHPDYPEVKDISMFKGREPEPLVECNGFCGLDDMDVYLEKKKRLNNNNEFNF